MAENSDQILHFHEYFKIIRNRAWVIFTIFALTVLSGWYVTNQVLPKIYTATSQIQILSRGVVDISGLVNGRTDPGFDPTAFEAEFEIMQSPNVLSPIITDLQLDKTWAKRLHTSLDALPPQDALAILQNNLHLDFKRGSNIIEISVTSEVPTECRDIANALADRYKTMRDVEEDQRAQRGAEALRDEIKEQQGVVEENRAALEKLRQDLTAKGISLNSNGTTDAAGERLETALDDRDKELLDAKEDYEARKVLLNSVINLPDDQFIDTLQGMGRLEASISDMRTQILKEATDITNLEQLGYGVDNPRIQSMQAEMDARKKQLADLVAGYRRAMQADLDVAKSRVGVLQAEVDDLTQRVSHDTTESLVPFRDQQRKLEQAQSLLDALNIRLKQDMADVVLQQSPVRIISRAETPESPTSPKKGLNYFVSVVAGLFVGIGVAFLIEYLDTSVKTMADAETLLGLPVLTVIPNKGGPMPLVQDAGRLPHAEGYRILRAKLDLKVQNGVGPSLTMLSGGPGEGKSTTIFNLAIVCAQAGQSVCLVDCDLRRPTLHELLGVTNERGLSNYLRGEGDAAGFIQRTPIPKLHILAAGNMPMSEIGVLAGDKIRVMLDDLKQRYDLVLIDAPPVLGISDGSIIAREVDYVILVIQHRRYPREISLRAKRAVEEVHGNCVGMVLNCVAVKSDDSYYYYSSYGNYYKKKAERKKKKSPAQANGQPAALASRKIDLDSDEF
jgi:capsular exopolysaccharide synthesis family protein